ncbi:NAD(P)-binding protein [Coniophora puteana RWD-64-598 SS2]|uniref:NAD(P)-binding protein n=1 Tax=Coniophora puteana (strain RWD-64-598) TaxID=741705 RepID=A0A5M3MY28_CONPW|nr:NAD(P)-binding protein [Coniophora puteana RWD-64-598 SS2]EIW84032.1 NAD(P)-binding protein [Coniophora puteana RWD-64-598 SS2]
MSVKTQVFVTGATGYIGGSVLQKVLAHPSAATSEFTLLVRSPEKARLLEGYIQAVGVDVRVLLGSHSDSDKLEAQAAQSDVIFAMANADDVGACKAILAGMKKRHAETGNPPVLIHTSGTGYAKTYIILPSTIYGLATGPLVDHKISNDHSVQVPALIKAGVVRKQGGVVNEGLNRWPCVHINDCVDLYLTVLDAILAGKPVGHGREGLYFGENGEYQAYALAKTVAQVLAEVGKGQSREPIPFTAEEYEKAPSLKKFGTNSRCHAKRARSLGWGPIYTYDDLIKSIKPEVEALLTKPIEQWPSY